MTTKTVDIQTTQMSIQELAALVADGAEIILTTGDAPFARLSLLKSEPSKRRAGLHEHLGHAWMSDDFNDELPDSFWLGEDESAE